MKKRNLNVFVAILSTSMIVTAFSGCSIISETGETSSTILSTEDDTAATSTTPSSAEPDSTEQITAIESGDPTSEEEVAYPITVTDMLGREVTIEKKPERIVSGYYISTSALIALDLKESLVGIEAKADKRKIYKLAAPELAALPNVGSLKEFDLEGCVALSPDLVILAAKQKGALETLETLGIPAIVVNPEGFEDQASMIRLLGQACDRNEQADTLLSYIDDKEAWLSDLLADETDHPRTYLAGNSAFLSTASNKMFQAEQIVKAGGENVAAEIDDTYWVEVSYEQVITWNPDVIILASDAEYTVDDVLNDSNLSEISAVKNQQVYKLPADAEAWDSPVPASILGTIQMANYLHPTLITADDCTEVINEYYNTFYQFTYSE